jgi:hypothetical protein
MLVCLQRCRRRRKGAAAAQSWSHPRRARDVGLRLTSIEPGDSFPPLMLIGLPRSAEPHAACHCAPRCFSAWSPPLLRTRIARAGVSRRWRAFPEELLSLALLGPTRGKFDIIAAWPVDRLGRSLQHLVEFLGDLHEAGRDLYLHQQAIDTSTPSGKAMFQMCGVFAEFERGMIRERVNAGLARARDKGVKLGRPRIAPQACSRSPARSALASARCSGSRPSRRDTSSSRRDGAEAYQPARLEVRSAGRPDLLPLEPLKAG